MQRRDMYSRAWCGVVVEMAMTAFLREQPLILLFL
jgi:hypothetical protein